MPKVLLTQASKDADREAKMDTVLNGAVGRYCAINRKKQYEVAEACGIKKSAFSQRMQNVGNVRLRDLRKLAHKVSMTPEEWLQLGGFAK